MAKQDLYPSEIIAIVLVCLLATGPLLAIMVSFVFCREDGCCCAGLRQRQRRYHRLAIERWREDTRFVAADTDADADTGNYAGYDAAATNKSDTEARSENPNGEGSSTPEPQAEPAGGGWRDVQWGIGPSTVGSPTSLESTTAEGER